MVTASLLLQSTVSTHLPAQMAWWRRVEAEASADCRWAVELIPAPATTPNWWRTLMTASVAGTATLPSYSFVLGSGLVPLDPAVRGHLDDGPGFPALARRLRLCHMRMRTDGRRLGRVRPVVSTSGPWSRRGSEEAGIPCEDGLCCCEAREEVARRPARGRWATRALLEGSTRARIAADAMRTHWSLHWSLGDRGASIAQSAASQHR